MDLVLDISQDELPIFLAETDEHLQVLDEGLLRLERQEFDSDLIQQIFRSAHTLKGSAGMIGHQRMVELTHALEMAFDGIRKNDLVVNSHLVDICLDAVDALRVLRDEVAQGQTSEVNVHALANQINEFIRLEKEAAKSFSSPAAEPGAVPENVQPAGPPAAESDSRTILWIEATISPKSIASAARAFQLMLAMQDLGDILSMEPSQEQVETAAPVAVMRASLKTERTLDEVRKALSDVPEVDQISVNANHTPVNPPTAAPITALKAQSVQSPATDSPVNYYEEIAPRLGDFLITKGYVNQAQLDQALDTQKTLPDPRILIGHVLVNLGYLQPNQLESAIAELLQQQRKVIQNLAPSTGPVHGKASEKTVRTSVERLDSLMNLVGELITDRNRLFKIRGDLEVQMRGHEDVNSLVDAVTHISRITDQLQEEVMRIRMLPVSNVFNKFPRMVRDLAQKVGKEIQLVIQGQDTEMDRSVIEEINDPLIHLLRNAIDHGIEPPADRAAKGKTPDGTIRLTARHEQGQIILTIEDDGRGINTDKLKQSAVQKGFLSELEASQLTPDKAIDLIFISGLTTAKNLTDISGRGVGMDIVRSNIEKINGSILVDTKLDVGTRFQIILPLTLAIVPTLLVRVGATSYAIPLIMVTETLRIKPQETQTINGRPVILLRNQVLPIIKLGEIFDQPMDSDVQGYSYVVVVSSNKLRIGLVVDTLLGEEEVVVKSLSSFLGEITGISSAAILGDGQVSLIVDIPGLFKLAGIH